MTGEASRKSRQTIRRYHRNNPSAKLVVTGCSVKYSGNTSIKNLLKDVEEFNRLPNDKSSLKECKRLFNNAMRTLAEILDAHEALNYDYKLQLKKKQYVIDGLKKFIDDKEALDAEIPSDDDEEESSDEKELKKGLSRRELSIMKSLNK